MTPVLVVDYGMGNIGSVCHALDVLGVSHQVSNRATDLFEARAIVLPGVGAFAAAMQNLRDLNLVEPLTEAVVQRSTPFLGICLGMQLLARDSVENGLSQGLGWLDGHVLALDASPACRVPHVGWNSVIGKADAPLFQRLGDDAHFYFDHSFHLECPEDWVDARCDHGRQYVAAVRKNNIMAVQFHPEKSQRSGLKLLRNFLNLVDARAASHPAPC